MLNRGSAKTASRSRTSSGSRGVFRMTGTRWVSVFADPRFSAARAVVVRDHGAYIWGDDVLEAKRHTEVYHFLFEATVARRGRQ